MTEIDKGDEYIVALVTKDEVLAVARALAPIDDADMRRRYEQLVPRDYDAGHGDDDREYTVANFRDVADLYQRAATAGRAVIFTAISVESFDQQLV